MAEVKLSGGRAATYQVVGRAENEPLLFFPGGPGFPASIVEEDAELFADRFAVYLVDPHGSGGSTPPANTDDYSPEGTARFYNDVRQALDLGTVNVGGHSFGSVTALAFAAMFPEVTSRCMAIATRVMGAELDIEEDAGGAAAEEAGLSRHDGAAWYPSARKTIDEWTERVLATDDASEVDAMSAEVMPLYLAHPDRPDVRERLDAWLAKAAGCDLQAIKVWESGLYQHIDLRPLLPQITAPTLVVAGEHDFICGPIHAEPIIAAVPNAELVVLPDVGHGPSLEEPQAYQKAVLDWVARTPVGS